MVNTSLTYETLVHSIKVASSKAIIVSKELLPSLEPILHDLEDLEIFIYDDDFVKTSNRKTVDLLSELKLTSNEPVNISNISSKDKLFYIYTSGTTGKPKGIYFFN